MSDIPVTHDLITTQNCIVYYTNIADSHTTYESSSAPDTLGNHQAIAFGRTNWQNAGFCHTLPLYIVTVDSFDTSSLWLWQSQNFTLKKAQIGNFKEVLHIIGCAEGCVSQNLQNKQKHHIK